MTTRSLRRGTLLYPLLAAMALGVLQEPAGSKPVDDPRILEVFVTFDDPAHGGVDTLTILGEQLDGAPDVSLGTFGSLPLLASAPTTIVVGCPPDPGSGGTPRCVEGDFRLTVTTGSKRSAGFDLTVPGRSEHQVATAVSAGDSSAFKSVTAQCPAGLVVLGGGGRILFAPGTGFDGQALLRSHPGGASSWVVAATEVNPTSNAWQLVADAVCARLE